jgi:hypothetical protein
VPWTSILVLNETGCNEDVRGVKVLYAHALDAGKSGPEVQCPLKRRKVSQICIWQCLCWWGKTISLNCGQKRASCSSPRWYIITESQGAMPLTGESRRKLVPPPLCPPQIPHDLTLARTRASAVRGRRLTAWDMTRPCTWQYTILHQGLSNHGTPMCFL